MLLIFTDEPDLASRLDKAGIPVTTQVEALETYQEPFIAIYSSQHIEQGFIAYIAPFSLPDVPAWATYNNNPRIVALNARVKLTLQDVVSCIKKYH